MHWSDSVRVYIYFWEYKQVGYMCVVHIYSVCVQVRVPVCVCIILFSLCKRGYSVQSDSIAIIRNGSLNKDKALHFQRHYASTESQDGRDRGEGALIYLVIIQCP